MGDIYIKSECSLVSEIYTIQDCEYTHLDELISDSNITLINNHSLPFKIEFDVKKTETAQTNAVGLLKIGSSDYPHIGFGFGSSPSWSLVLYERRTLNTNNQLIDIPNSVRNDWIHVEIKIYSNSAVMTVNDTDYSMNGILVDLSAPLIVNGSSRVIFKNIKLKPL